jgi:hypothetical protein
MILLVSQHQILMFQVSQHQMLEIQIEMNMKMTFKIEMEVLSEKKQDSQDHRKLKNLQKKN